MKINKLNKIMGVVFTVGMLLSMLSAFAGAVPASADTLAFSADPSAPSASTNSLTSYAVSADRKTIYAVDASSSTPGVYKSTNGGLTLSKTTFNPGMFTTAPNTAPVAQWIAVAPDDPTIVAFASNANVAGTKIPVVYLSTNGGSSGLP
jgi:hypothetical protein